MQLNTRSIYDELIQLQQGVDEATTFELYGLEWDIFPGVYAPHLTQGAALYVDWLDFQPNTSFCEIGSGTGYLSVLAALHGCTRVIASDISKYAVSNSQINVIRHGVESIVDVRESNLFSAMRSDEKVDAIFWNSSFIDEIDDNNDSSISVSLCDPDYELHASYLKQAPNYLAPGGRLYLGFSDLGNFEKLQNICEKLNFDMSVVRAAHVETAHGPIVFQLIEIAGNW